MKKIIKAVATITVFAVLTRAMGFLLRIYMSRKLGAELLGTYQVAISVFGVFCTLICSGLPLMISRSVASSFSKGNLKTQNQVVSSGLLTSISLSALMCGIVFFFPQIVDVIFTSKDSTKILIWLLPGVIASAVYCTFRGALWGQKRFFWISFSEFIEQVARIIFIVVLFELLPNLASGGVLAAISLSAACVVSAIVVAILYFAYGGKLASPIPQFVPLLKTSSPVTAIRTATALGSFAIAILVPLRLVASGMTKSRAMSLFGMASGMALPLLMIPCTLIGSLATAVVPEISENLTDPKDLKNCPNYSAIRARMNSSFNASMVISFLLVPAFLCLGPEIGKFLFNSPTAGTYVSHGAIFMIPMCLSQITTSFMNASGMEQKSMLNYAAGALLLFASIYFLTPLIGANSLIVGMGSMYTTTCALNITILGKRGLLSKSHVKTALILTLYCVPCCVLTYYTYILFNMFCPFVVSLFVAGIVSVVSYFSLCTLFHQLDIQVFFQRRKKKV